MLTKYHTDVILSRLCDTMYHICVILHFRHVFDTEKFNNWTLTFYESDRKLNIDAKLYTPAHISQPFRIRIFKESRENTINLPQEFTRLCQQVKVVCV